MISNLAYISKFFYIFNQIKSKSMYLLLGLDIIKQYIKNLCYFINTLIFIDNKTNIYTK